ncbi:MAG: glycerol acyltransferase [Curvibacter sp. GWA2_64_110]|nr:MAG: glycerol acyltransferase [Curvibacter sp. GWA2_64_110]HCY17357.1 1-acyl-sn-glycerol-3-phosphate acyltransferase [Curvibacter sp.]
MPSRPESQVSAWRAAWRLWRAVPHILAGLLTILFRFPRLSQEQREIRVQVWSREMLARLGVRLVVKGTPSTRGPVLLVANHISWLDITSLHAARYCRFVSKADVKGWPLIGALASGVGTLFIERESRRDAMRVVHHMADSLRAGDVVAVFPEGTTSDGVHLLPFHANLLQAAITAEVPVQPVALQFLEAHTGQRSLAPCYVGDDTLLGSVWRTVRARGITVQMVFGEPQVALGRDRRTWAADLRATIEQLRQLSPRV